MIRQVFVVFLLMGISISNISFAMDDEQLSPQSVPKQPDPAVVARCDAFDAIHRALSFSSSDINADPYNKAFKRLGQLMSAEERKILDDGTFPSALGPLKDIYDSVWKEADVSSPMTREDIDLLASFLEDDLDANGSSLSDLLDDLFVNKFGASAPPSTPAEARSNPNGTLVFSGE